MEHSFISATILLILITDPLGNIPLLILNLKNVATKRRNFIIIRECLIAFGILVVFMLFGKNLLGLLQLSQETLKVAGGIILFLISLNMIFPDQGPRAQNGHENQEPFIVPIAIPLVAGPSAMVTSMLIATSNPARIFEWISALAIAMIVIFFAFFLSAKLERILGNQLLAAIEKLMGLVLITISIEMLLSGTAEYIKNLAH